MSILFMLNKLLYMNAGEAFGGFGNAPQEIRPQGGTELHFHITKTE